MTKRIITLVLGIILTANIWAQAPEKMSYQAVVRDANNNLVTNQIVGMQISILQGSATGTAVYVETQTPTTNANGLVSLEIGSGNVISGDFTAIDWANDTYFIKTETDPTGGVNYTITGTSQLLSVPYALHSGTADSITGTVHYTEMDPVFGASVANGITALDTAFWNNKLDVEKDSSITNEIQILSISSDTIFLSSGGYVKLPAGFDGQYSSLAGAPTNVSTFTNDAGYLTTEVDSSVTNELQALSISNDTIFLSNGGFAKLPAGFDGQYSSLTGAPTNVSAFTNDAGYLTTEMDSSVTNEIQNLSLSGDTLYISSSNNVDLSTLDNGSWSTSGNSGTTPGTDFIGTTDNQPIILKANNQFVGKIGPGNSDLFIGYNSGNSSLSTTAKYNVGIGAETMKNITAQADYNTAVGYQALMSADSGSKNIAMGYQALYSNTTGAQNVGIGYMSQRSNTTGMNNTSVGTGSLFSNTTGGNNTAMGSSSLGFNTTGINNSAFGIMALGANTTGSENVALGSYTLTLNTTGSNNTAIGREALYSNTSGIENTAIGYQTLRYNTTGSRNIAIGMTALYSNTTGFWNTAIGFRTLYSNTIGIYNVAMGYNSMYSNTTGYGNIALGYEPLYSNTTGAFNTALGYYALRYNTTGSYNQAIGRQALLYNTTGIYNVSVGAFSLENTSTGSQNTAIGMYAGYSNNLTNRTAIGYYAQNTSNSQVRLGNSSVYSIGGYANWSNISDKRFKTNVKEDVSGLDFIMKLRPVSYNLDMDAIAAFYHTPDSVRLFESEALKAAETQTGFIAQEVEAAAQEVGFAFHGVDAPQNENDHYGLRYAEFVVPMVKAMQEQQVQINTQQQIIKQQQKTNEDLQRQIDELRKLIEQP